MKAAVYDAPGTPDVLTYATVADPVPGPDQVLVKVHAIGLQGGDVRARAADEVPSPQHVVGYQVAGVIEAVGSGVTDRTIGQRVAAIMLNGSHAERAVADSSWTWVLPESMDFDTAAAVPVEFGTAHETLFEFGGLTAGQTVLVQAGSGGFGLAAIQLAKAAGATVISTASSPERLERLSGYGVDHGIDYTKVDTVSEVMRITNGRGVDLAIDPVGGPALAACIDAVAYRGTVVFIGTMGGDESAPDLIPLLLKNASLRGYYLVEELVRDNDRATAIIAEQLDRVFSGEFTAVLDRTFALSEAAQAHRRVQSREAFGRVIIKP
ncbi:NADP-dependent oxidoreductase [Aeromicrobium sp. Root344]|uniref:quinone oxidoreductase family protein n=1 Tax=Aeromicrobium sp. Root344 TaxID=1736521 RepID=UPI0006F53990|nr:zinc-binding dehydrogenase [Aeromicrobium sp. Root344]KQV75206.1 NADP-dependent oxidoreductase [Aeromicrobium sp. Root344]